MKRKSSEWQTFSSDNLKSFCWFSILSAESKNQTSDFSITPHQGRGGDSPDKKQSHWFLTSSPKL